MFFFTRPIDFCAHRASGRLSCLSSVFAVMALGVGVLCAGRSEAAVSAQRITAGLITVTAAYHPGDFDQDNDIDVADASMMIDCLSGPDVPSTDPACADADLDLDGDVDQSDFGFEQLCFSGNGVAVDQGCTTISRAPEMISLSRSSSQMMADGTSQHSVTLTVRDANGVADIRDMRVMFNYDGDDLTAARGYLAWGQTEADITIYGGTWTMAAAAGGGHYGFQTDGGGSAYIAPVSASTSTVGFQRSVTWVFKIHQVWADDGPVLGNFGGMWARDNVQYTGWKDSRSDLVAPVTFAVLNPQQVVPVFDSLAVAFDQDLPDGRKQFNATLVATDANGVSDLRDMRIMFNIYLDDSTRARGYLAWGHTAGDVAYYGGPWSTWAATGGGYYGIRTDDWGADYITPVAATTTTDGPQRTVTWTFAVEENWQVAGPVTGNYAGMFSRDQAANSGWQDSRWYFDDPVIFDIGTVAHPCLMANPTTLAMGQQRIADNLPWALEIKSRLEDNAALLAAMDMPVFETEWWIEASQKPWSQIYPEIFEHTYNAIKDPPYLAKDVATLYALTGDPSYFNMVRDVLLHYSTFDFFAIHPDVGLNFSIWCTYCMQAYDFVYNDLSVQDRVVIDDFFSRAKDAIKANDEWWIADGLGGAYNNHYAFHKKYIGSYGLFYGMDDWVTWSLDSTMGMGELIANGTKDDGLWHENSLNYQFAAVNPMSQYAMHLTSSGWPVDLWTQTYGGKSMQQLFLGPVNVLYPDRTIPTIGDCYGARGSLYANGWYFNAYNAYQDPTIAWIMDGSTIRLPKMLFLEHQPTGSVTPSMTSRAWPEHGYAAVRSDEGTGYWDGDGFSAFLVYHADGIHGHNDKLSFTAYARDAHIALDPEAIASAAHPFSSNVQGTLNRTIAPHNTVMVEWENQQYITQKLELTGMGSTGDLEWATMADRTGMLYSGIRQMRTIGVCDDYLLDIFQCASDDEHMYQYMFHAYDDNGYFTIPGLKDITFGTETPWTWLTDWKDKWVGHDSWDVTAQQGDLTTRLTMAGQPTDEYGTVVVCCKFPKNDGLEEPAIPMVIVNRRLVTATTYIAVLQAERGTLPAVSISSQEINGGADLQVSVTSNGNTRTLVVEKLQ